MNSSKEPSDEILFQYVRFDDSNAFSELYNRYVRQLYNYGYRLCGDKALVQDAVQDVFIEIWNRKQNLGEVKNAKAYLLSCVRRKISLVAKPETEANSYTRLCSVDESPYEQPMEDMTVSEENLGQMVRCIRSQLESLPKREHECVHLRFFEDLSYEEIAQVMNITPQSARNMVGKALARLRQSLPRHFFFSILAAFLLLFL